MHILGIIYLDLHQNVCLENHLLIYLAKYDSKGLWAMWKSLLLNHLVVATDDKRIYKHVNEFGGNVIMTSITHESGTDRCNEVVLNSNMAYDIVVNIQGDEPFINPNQIDQIITNLLDTNADIATLAKKIDDLKLVFDTNNQKLFLIKNKNCKGFCTKNW